MFRLGLIFFLFSPSLPAADSAEPSDIECLTQLGSCPEIIDRYVRQDVQPGCESQLFRAAGNCYFLMGEKERALAAYRRYSELIPDDRVINALVGALGGSAPPSPLRYRVQLEYGTPLVAAVDLSLFTNKHQNFGLGALPLAAEGKAWGLNPRWRYYRAKQDWDFFIEAGGAYLNPDTASDPHLYWKADVGGGLARMGSGPFVFEGTLRAVCNYEYDTRISKAWNVSFPGVTWGLGAGMLF